MSITHDALKKLQQEGAFADENSTTPTEAVDVPSQGDITDASDRATADDAAPVTADECASDECASDECAPDECAPDECAPDEETVELTIEINEASPDLADHLEEIAELELLAQSEPNPVSTDRPEVELKMTGDISAPEDQNDEVCEAAIEEAWDELATLAETKSLEAELHDILSSDYSDTDDAPSVTLPEDTSPTSDAAPHGSASQALPELSSPSVSDETAPDGTAPDEMASDEMASDEMASDEMASDEMALDSGRHGGCTCESRCDCEDTTNSVADDDVFVDQVESDVPDSPTSDEIDQDVMDQDVIDDGETDDDETEQDVTDDDVIDDDPIQDAIDDDRTGHSSYSPVIPSIDELLDEAQEFSIHDTIPLNADLSRRTSDDHESDTPPDTSDSDLSTVVPVVTELDSPERPVENRYGTLRTPSSESAGFDQHLLHLYSAPECRDAIKQFVGNVKQQCADKLPKTLLLASVTENRRAAEVLGLLAMERSTQDERILLIDADLKNQGLTREYNALGKRGLCDILSETSDATAVVLSTATPGIHLVPCGDDVQGISRQSGQFSERSLVQALRAWETEFDRILINAGPGESTLLGVLGRNSEATLLLVHDAQAEPTRIGEMAAQLKSAATRVIGCVVTDFPESTVTST